MTNYRLSTILGSTANKSRRRLNRTTLAAIAAYLLALALMIW